jgi:hypothetical protein
MSKTRITLAVEEDARKLIERYGGKRAIGKLFVDLIRKHHSEENLQSHNGKYPLGSD